MSLLDHIRGHPPCLFLLKWSPFPFSNGHNGKAPTGRQPSFQFCIAAPCNHGLENFCLGYLPTPEWQNLNQIKLQPYKEWRDVDRKLMKSQMNGFDFTVVMSCMRAYRRVEGKKITSSQVEIRK
ncbi:hypothetical protein TNCV_2454021 [Trichonephila clavipes]|nr:hypothetical protein TNCV_2454021 [Trichonephila clavipes]